MIAILSDKLTDKSKDILIDTYLPIVGVDDAQWISPGQRVKDSVELVVAVGIKVWPRVGANWKWRGHLLDVPYQGKPCLPTLSPADSYKTVWGRAACLSDWGRVRYFLEGSYPRETPDVLIATYFTKGLVEAWFDRAMTAAWCVLDCEYSPKTGQLYHLGIAIPNSATLYVDWLKGGVKELIGAQLARTISVTPIIMHNALADVPVLRQAMGIDWPDYRQLEDTCLAHACLYSGGTLKGNSRTQSNYWPHDLEFLASIYGQYRKMKQFHHRDVVRYNQGDVLETGSIWDKLSLELKGDTGAERDYRNRLKILPLIEGRMREGIQCGDKKRAGVDIPQWVKEYHDQAAEATGVSINLNSPQQVKKSGSAKVVELREKVMQLRRVKKEFGIPCPKER